MTGAYNFLASVGRVNSLVGVYLGSIVAAILVLAAPIYIIAQHRRQKAEGKDAPIVPSVVLPILGCFLVAFLVLFITRLSRMVSQQSKPWAAVGGAWTVMDVATMPFRN